MARATPGPPPLVVCICIYIYIYARQGLFPFLIVVMEESMMRMRSQGSTNIQYICTSSIMQFQQIKIVFSCLIQVSNNK
jgi:hypothetical protein